MREKNFIFIFKMIVRLLKNVLVTQFDNILMSGIYPFYSIKIPYFLIFFKLKFKGFKKWPYDTSLEIEFFSLQSKNRKFWTKNKKF